MILVTRDILIIFIEKQIKNSPTLTYGFCLMDILFAFFRTKNFSVDKFFLHFLYFSITIPRVTSGRAGRGNRSISSAQQSQRITSAERERIVNMTTKLLVATVG